MTKGSAQRYDVDAGGRVYRDLTAGVIVHNIKAGKLKRTHRISPAGAERWVALSEVPQLREYFPQVVPERASFQVKRGDGEIQDGLSHGQLVEMIRFGKLQEADNIRHTGDEEWSMAGDMESLQRYFDLRRHRIATGGFKSAEDTGIPFYKDYMAPLKYFLTSRYVINMLAILIMVGIAEAIQIPIVKFPIIILTSFYVGAYYFRAITAAADGATEFPEFPDMSDFTTELIRPSIQYFLSRTVALLPLLAYISEMKLRPLDLFDKSPILFAILNAPWLVITEKFPRFETVSMGEFTVGVPTGTEYLALDVFIWLGLIFFLLYLPIALMRQSSYGEFLPTFNFPAIVISISRAAGPYLLLVIFMLAIDFISLLLIAAFNMLLEQQSIMMLFAEVAAASGQVALWLMVLLKLVFYLINITAMFLKMYYIGRFLYQNETRMGWD